MEKSILDYGEMELDFSMLHLGQLTTSADFTQERAKSWVSVKGFIERKISFTLM